MNPKRPVDLQQHDQNAAAPYVDPSLDPRAVGYALGAAARHGKPPKVSTPVAGGPPPAMPALEQPHQLGMPMSAQAPATYGQDSVRTTAAAMVAHARRGDSIISEDANMPQAQPQGQVQLMPTDTLPEEAKKDIYYQKGMGAEAAMNQPMLARKYGVIRAGQYIPPNALAMGSAPAPQAAPSDFRQRMRRPAEETAADLQALQAAQSRVKAAEDAGDVQAPSHLPRTDKEAEEQAAKGPGGVAALAGGATAPIVSAEDQKRADESRLRALLANMDDVDFAMLQQEMIKDVLKNPDQRDIIEARLEPLDIDDLIMRNQVTQKVPVIPGRFEPTFESQTAEVEMMLKQLLTSESKAVAVTEGYLMQKYALMSTTAGTKAINNNLLPTMYDSEGNFNEDLFWKKYQWMLKKPMHMLASLGIHYAWFEARVRKMFKVEKAKNG